MADYLLAAQRSATQDRAVHRTSPITAVKSLRWLAKTVQWQELSMALSAPIVASYAHLTKSVDRRESYPLPMALVAGFEKAVCSSDTSNALALFLGAVLLCTHASVRFGDAQRIAWSSLQLSRTALNGTCYRTKTSTHGQPFACRWHGITGRDYRSSWVLQWLGRLAKHCKEANLTLQGRAEPDFVFINCNPLQPLPTELAPASYARTLMHLRWASQSTLVLISQALRSVEACELTLHNMKSTLRACAAQLNLNKEDCMAQGHHRDSALLYSRNDSYASPHTERNLHLHCTGAQHGKGAQAPLLSEPPFSAAS